MAYVSEVRVDIPLSERTYYCLLSLAENQGKTLETLIVELLTQESDCLARLLDQRCSE